MREMQEIQVFLSLEDIEKFGLWNRLRFHEIQDHVARLVAIPEALKNAYATAAVESMTSGEEISVDYPGLLEPELYKGAMMHNIRTGHIYHLPDQELKKKELRDLASELLDKGEDREYDTLWNSWVGEALNLPWRERDLVYPPLYSATVECPLIKDGVSERGTMYWIGTKHLSQLGFIVETDACTLLDANTGGPPEGIAFKDYKAFAKALTRIGDALKRLTELKAQCRSGQEVFGIPTLRFEGEQSATVWEIEHRKPINDVEWGPLKRSNIIFAKTMVLVESLYGQMHIARPAKLSVSTYKWTQAFGWDTRCSARNECLLNEVVKDKCNMIAFTLQPKLIALVREHFTFKDCSLTVTPTLENGTWPAYAVALKATMDVQGLEGVYEKVFYINHCNGLDAGSAPAVDEKFHYFIGEVESWLDNLNNPEEEEEDEY